MADTVFYGFGSSPAVTLVGANNDTVSRIIQAPVSGVIRIRTIDIAVLQNGGAFSATTYVAVTIVSGPDSLGTNGQLGKLVGPFRPTGTSLVGFAQIPDMAGFQLVGQFYIRVQSPVPRNYGRNDITARNSDKLAVIVSGLIDGSTNTPVMNLQCGAALTVLGDIELDTSKLENKPMGGIVRSLARF